MPILSHPAFGPRTSLLYITAGTLLDVWTGVWYFAFIRGGDKPLSNTTWFWLVGLFLTGLTLITIGALLGQIGQAARRAELPPPEAQDQEAKIQAAAAANPNPVAPVMAGVVPGAAPGYVPPQPVAPAATAAPMPGGVVGYGS